MQTKPNVVILADSISEEGKRLTTFQIECWRAIMPEITRHRKLSFNIQSSRARDPVKLIKDIQQGNGWGPNVIYKNELGMSGSYQLPKEQEDYFKEYYEELGMLVGSLVDQFTLKFLKKYNCVPHKQTVNRLLEPFCSVNMVVSGVEWRNFFDLRISPHAQPEMFDLAVAMDTALKNSKPKLLKPGEWHLPYITDEEKKTLHIEEQKRISVARIARVSYKPYDGKYKKEADLALAERLASNSHFSCFEHVATPATKADYRPSNFIGWNQYRKEFFSEFMPG